MSVVFRLVQRVLGFSKARSSEAVRLRRIQRDLTRFAEGDRVLIDGARLSPPLRQRAKSNFYHGALLHDDLIGRPVCPQYVDAPKGKLYKIEQPSLDQYVSLTPRLVTPVRTEPSLSSGSADRQEIYATYASTIVSLLDLHPPPYKPSSDALAPPAKWEVLEAGTGHGSLSLHIARAIAAANPPPPDFEIPISRPELPTAKVTAEEAEYHDAICREWAAWKQRRRAVLHTVEKFPANRFHAEGIVRGFRQGLYWPHVDFNVGTVADWIAEQARLRRGDGRAGLWTTSSSPFLDHVLLDLPSIHTQLSTVVPYMREGATLVAFVPSVTQIGDCARVIGDERLPLLMEKAIELGEGISTGRRWDVRTVQPRPAKEPGDETQSRAPEAEAEGDHGPMPRDPSDDSSQEDQKVALAAPPSTDDESGRQPAAPVLICRPLVGERVVGGGFIALWKKVSPENAALAARWRKDQTGWAKKRNR